MLKSIRRTFSQLKSGTSGNATMLVALGMPVLIGGAGMAVDTAQWYMWKREIQYAADQAALAGAWARTNAKSRDTYVTRAKQEFAANLSATRKIASTPQVRLEDYASGTQNSVVVTASATQLLPFSSFLTGEAADVRVFSRAAFTEGRSFTACFTALERTDRTGINFAGSSSFTAGCGLASLSPSQASIGVNGSPTLDPGWAVAAGGVSDYFDTNTNAIVRENETGLVDPFAHLTTPSPNPNPNRNYTCNGATIVMMGDIRTKTDTLYTYWQGENTNQAVQITNYTGSGYLPDVIGTWTSWTYNTTLPSGSVNGTTTVDGSPNWTNLGGNNSNRKWRRAVVRTTTELNNVESVETGGLATLSQGTYRGGFDVRCTTVFNPGIYVIDGGRLKIPSQHQVTGNGILIILRNGAFVDITGGAAISLTGASAAQLVNFGGLPAAQAQQFADMLIYEDRASPGTDGRNTLAGNSATVLNGKIYLPKSDLRFTGTASVTSACLMIAALRINLGGTTDISNMCPTGLTHTDIVSNSRAKVRLVE